MMLSKLSKKSDRSERRPLFIKQDEQDRNNIAQGHTSLRIWKDVVADAITVVLPTPAAVLKSDP